MVAADIGLLLAEAGLYADASEPKVEATRARLNDPLSFSLINHHHRLEPFLHFLSCPFGIACQAPAQPSPISPAPRASASPRSTACSTPGIGCANRPPSASSRRPMRSA